MMTQNQRMKYFNLIQKVQSSGNFGLQVQLAQMDTLGKTVNFSKLSVPKLKKIAKNQGIPIQSKMKKANIIRKLRGN
jgi:hypothetical protein